MGLQNYQQTRYTPKGAKVDMGNVIRANNSATASALGAVNALDQFRRIKNDNAITELLANSDSANYGKNLGKISALAGDATQDGVGSAALGLGNFQKKAGQDLTGLGRILAAYKPTAGSNSRLTNAYTTALAKANKLKRLEPRSDMYKDDAQYIKDKYKWEQNLKSAMDEVALKNSAAASYGGGTGNQAGVDEAARTMNKYFDRKMRFPLATASGGGSGTGGGGTESSEDTPIEKIVRQIEGPEIQPFNIQNDNPENYVDGGYRQNMIPGFRELNPPAGRPGPTRVDLDGLKQLPIKGDWTKALDQIEGRNPKLLPQPRPSGRAVIPRPSTDAVPEGTPKTVLESLFETQEKTKAGVPATYDPKIDAQIDSSQAPRTVKEKLKAMYRKGMFAAEDVIDELKNFGTKNAGAISDIGKGMVRGMPLSTTDTGGGEMFYDKDGNQLEQSFTESLFGIEPDGSVYSRHADEIYMGPERGAQGGNQGNAQGTQGAQQQVGVQPTFKQDEPNAFDMDFSQGDTEQTIAQNTYNYREAQRAVRELKLKAAQQSGVDRLATNQQIQQIESMMAENKAETIPLTQLASVEREFEKYEQNPTLMPRTVQALIKDVAKDPDMYRQLQQTLSTRSASVLKNILDGNTIRSEGKYAVSLGDDSAWVGASDPLLLTGDSRIDLAKKYIQLMLSMSQSEQKTEEFINQFPEDKRQVLYDQISLNSQSVYKDKRSNPFARNFRNTTVENADLTPTFNDSREIKDFIDDKIGG